MTGADYRLALAVALSLLLHAAPFINIPPTAAPAAPLPPPIEAVLRPPPAAPAQAPLVLPEQPAPRPETQPARISAAPQAPARIKTWQEEIRRQIKKQDERGQFYPPEAIAQGLQGVVIVLLIIDEAGQVSAARVEQSSGHRLLDEAALRAVRALRSLPADAPRDTLLPVSFRLK